MASYVYLIQNGDLFNIGFTNNLERTRIDLRPGELVAFLITDKPEPLVKNLRKTYVDNRLPGSDYYRKGRDERSPEQLRQTNLLHHFLGTSSQYQDSVLFCYSYQYLNLYQFLC